MCRTGLPGARFDCRRRILQGTNLFFRHSIAALPPPRYYPAATAVTKCSIVPFQPLSGIFSALPDPFITYDNTFLVGRPGDCPVEPAYKPITGVHAEGDAPPLGIDLTDNYFEGSGNDPQETAIGTDCFSIGAMENNIRKNNYEALSTGNRASGNNGGPQGLHYECNENNNAYADFEVTSGSSVRAVQGEKDNDLQITTAAGNTFSTSAYTWLNDRPNY
ncbi:MAG: hypothetical protein IPH12_00495 [Saprospirales bacterium]|nr:hypothetical protein [Saprospirales bacterium]